MAAPVVVPGGTTAIEGVRVVPLRRIVDHRGAVAHMLRATDPHFPGFGEVYFSSVFPGVVKAWKRHHRVTVSYACAFGRIKVVLYDGRPASPTCGAVMEVLLGPDNHALVQVPPGVWSGFSGLSEPEAVLANCATEPYDPTEFDRCDPHAATVPYRW